MEKSTLLTGQMYCSFYQGNLHRDAYPSAAACGRVSQETWSQSNRTHFTAHGSRVEGAKETVHCPSELLVHSQNRKGTREKSCAKVAGPKSYWGNGWSLMENREISDWRLGVKKPLSASSQCQSVGTSREVTATKEKMREQETGTGWTRGQQCACQREMTLTMNWNRAGTCWWEGQRKLWKKGRRSRYLRMGLGILYSLKKTLSGLDTLKEFKETWV